MKIQNSKPEILNGGQRCWFVVLAVVSFFVLFMMSPGKVLAQGLEVEWGPEGKVFDVSGTLPGDTLSRSVSVRNDYSGTIMIELGATKQLEEKDFSEVLDMTVTADGLVVYGGLLEDFFGATPLLLFSLDPNETKAVDFDVYFHEDAGNEYQLARVVFDLEMMTVSGGSIVINEVYYQVDEAHGLDSPKDRGFGSEEVLGQIIGNGAGSVNGVNISIDWRCRVTQINENGVDTNVSIGANTGGNSGGGVSTGNSNVFVNIFNSVGLNRISGWFCGRRLGQNHEWVELYNPTNESVQLQGWGLRDNSGVVRRINRRLELGSGEFVLVSKGSSVWRFWDEPRGVVKVSLGREIGDGLDNVGDHLDLLDPDDMVVDRVGWGADTSVWDPAVGLVGLGASLEREILGVDTDLASDWGEQVFPTPGE